METKSTHPPEAVQTSLPTTIQPADTSTPPLPATEDEATRKERRENFRRALDLFRTYEKLDSGESSSSDLKKDSFRSSDSRCVSRKEKARSYDIDIDFKKNPDDKCAFRPVSLPVRLDFLEADGDSFWSSDSWLGSLESLSSDLKKDSFQSSDSRISLERKVSSKYRHVSSKRRKTFNRTAFKKNPDDKCAFRSASDRPDSSDSPSSHPLKDVAAGDRYSVLSSDSGLGSLESLSSDLKKDSFQPSDSGCVSKKEKARSYHCDIDFKKNPDDKCAFRPVSLPVRPDSSDSPSSHPLKDVAAGDRYSVLSSDSGLGSLESLSSDLKKDSFRSSDSRCVSRNEMQRSCHRDIDFKKNQEQLHKPDSQVLSRLKVCTGNLSRSASLSPRPYFSESPSSHPLKDVATADGDSVLSSDSGPDHKCSFKSASLPRLWDFRDSSSSDSKKVATADGVSVLSSDSGISLERKVSSGSSCESSKKKKEKTTPPTIQELVGSSAGIET